MTAFYR